MVPLVSVIIPVFNGEKYVSSAISSVLRQDYPNVEIIVINDGSKDQTEEILLAYSDKVHYYYKENGDSASARNLGLKVAKGEFIAFLDADDLYEESKISKQVRALSEKRDYGFVYCDAKVIDSMNEILYTLRSEKVFVNREDALAYALYRLIIPAPSAIMVRRADLDKTIYYSEAHSNSEDYFFSIRLLMKLKPFYLPEALYCYRRHENNMTCNHEWQKQCEKDVVKMLGKDKIEQIVEEATFEQEYKVLLLSKIYYKIDDLDNAYSVLEQIKDIQDFECFFHKGVCEYQLKKYSEAIDAFKHAYKLDITRAEALNNIGCCYICFNQVELANKYFQRAFELKRGYMDAEFNVSNLSKELPDFKKHMKFTERSLRKVLTIY